MKWESMIYLICPMCKIFMFYLKEGVRILRHGMRTYSTGHLVRDGSVAQAEYIYYIYIICILVFWEGARSTLTSEQRLPSFLFSRLYQPAFLKCSFSWCIDYGIDVLYSLCGDGLSAPPPRLSPACSTSWSCKRPIGTNAL